MPDNDPDQRPPIVLVHGAWHGAWCWDHVVGALATDGWSVTAVTLPGHDRPGDAGRIWNRISEYIATVGHAVDEATAAAGRPAVLVGHSMGGHVVQRYLENADVALGVLVASAPLRGLAETNVRILRKYPLQTLRAALTADYSFAIDTDEYIRYLFFRPDTPDETVAEARAKLQNESAVAVNTMMVRWPRPSRVHSSVVVIAASDDAVFTRSEQQGLADAYSTNLRLIENSGHDIMLDENWPALVDAIVDAALVPLTS